MTIIPHEWQAYAALQAELHQRNDTIPTTWGMEAGLNYLLECPTTPSNAGRAIAAAARRSRYARGLLASFMTHDSSRIDGIAAMEARSSLEKITKDLPIATVGMLFDAACGDDADGTPGRLGISVPAFQTRLSRARSAARKIAA